jgi:hypothetical protein
MVRGDVEGGRLEKMEMEKIKIDNTFGGKHE